MLIKPGKGQEARKVEREVVVAATNVQQQTRLLKIILLLSAGLCVFAVLRTEAAVLPQDRSDAMYHSYQGGGISIDGPSILLRKQVSNQFSLSANYYVDSISGASIDVLATASPYAEERTEQSIGVDYLHNKTLMTLNYTTSSENDFAAKSVHMNISHDFFGDLTTLSMGYSKGWDEVGKTGDEGFLEEANRQNYRLGLTQILSKNMIMGLSWENISDNGYLNNPYRSVRFLDAGTERGYRFETEVYPETRTSNALALTANYYLPYRASIYGEARTFSDTWGIKASTFKVGYIHTFDEQWIVDVRIRQYQQDKADFYQDLFARSGETNFRARDKELSSFDNLSLGLSISYQYQFSATSWFKKATLNYELDHIQFNYDDFRNVLAEATVGEEPFYEFSANVTRLYLSLWY
jgi:nuclear transport factor 2 (NTF2) superfamily protein